MNLRPTQDEVNHLDEVDHLDPGDAHDAHAAAAQAARSPMRRRLLILLASLPTTVASTNRTSSIKAAGADRPPDSIPNLFTIFEALLTKHEASLWRCDRLEAWLLAELDHPRARLRTPAGIPVRYAADADTIAQHVPPGRRRHRLQQVLLRRQQAWALGARACSLTRAQEQEAALGAAVRAAAARLIAAPTRTVGGIRTKLLVLLAVQEPGEAFRDSSPWRELRLLLADLDTLAES